MKVKIPFQFYFLITALIMEFTGCLPTQNTSGSTKKYNQPSNNQYGPTSGLRNAIEWPFSSDSPWNMPIGNGAAYEQANTPCSTSLLSEADGAWINSAEWSHPIYRAKESDPVVPIVRVESARFVDFTEADVEREGEEQARIRIPSDAKPALPLDSAQLPTDGHLHIIDPSGRWLHEMWRAFPRKGGGWNVGYYVKTDLYGTGILEGGVRAYGGSAIGGLIRKGELKNGIRHALAIAQPNSHLSPKGPVWPADVMDEGGENNYSGDYPMGQLAAIPPSINLEAMNPPLSPQGLAIGKAMQNFGVYNVDSGGAGVVYAEPAVETELGEARDDVPRLWALLRCVSNNSPASIGGGGNVRRAPLAPPLPH